MQVHEKVGKSRFTTLFPLIWGSGESKSNLAKAAGAEPSGQMRDEKLHAVVARSTFQVKMYKTHQVPTTFGSSDVEKVHAVVVRSTFASKIAKNTSRSDHFCKLQCGKSALRWGAKHTFKSKVSNTDGLGPFLEVEMSKKCTPLWRQAHFEIKMHKTHRVQRTFGSWEVEKVDAVLVSSTFPSQKRKKLVPDHFWKWRCRKSVRRCGAKHISKSKCTTHTTFSALLEVERLQKWTQLWREAHFQVKSVKNWGGLDHFWTFRSGFAWQVQGNLHLAKREQNVKVLKQSQLQLQPQLQLRRKDATLNYIILHYTHYTTLHYTTLRYATLRYPTLHYTTLHYTTLHYTTLYPTPLHYTTLNYTTLHYTTLHFTTLHYTSCSTLHYNTFHYATFHFTTLFLYTTLHYTTLNYTTLNYTTLTTTKATTKAATALH